MEAEAPRKVSMREKAVEEFKEFVVLAAYLYVCLGAVLFMRSAYLQGAGFSYTPWVTAAVKAIVLAKFMLIGSALHMGGRYQGRPLIWRTLHESLKTLFVLLVLSTIEEAVIDVIDGRALADVLTQVAGQTFVQVVANSLMMFLILVPYFAFRCLGEVLGDRSLVRLFFVDRNAFGSADRGDPSSAKVLDP